MLIAMKFSLEWLFIIHVRQIGGVFYFCSFPHELYHYIHMGGSEKGHGGSPSHFWMSWDSRFGHLQQQVVLHKTTTLAHMIRDMAGLTVWSGI